MGLIAKLLELLSQPPYPSPCDEITWPFPTGLKP